MSMLQEKLLKQLKDLQKKASESDAAIIAKAEQDPKPEESVSNPAEGQTGAASDIITDSVGAEGLTQPGTASEVDKVDIEGAPAAGIDAAAVPPTEDGEAAEALDVKDGEVTKEEGIEMINKAASQIRRMRDAIQALPTEKIVGAFNKTASEKDNAQTLLYKAACAGDTTAQHLVDMLASYEVGLAKKASDMEEAIAATGATSPEQVAALEDALNAEALNDPAALMEEGEAVEDAGEAIEDAGEGAVDQAALEALAQAGAEIESAAQEATVEVASELMDADPELGEEEALKIAQGAVVDALQTMDVQQLLGAADEEGNFLVDDEKAAEAVEDLKKSASANPLRDSLVADLNAHFGLKPDAFAARLGIKSR